MHITCISHFAICREKHLALDQLSVYIWIALSQQCKNIDI